ncbi:MAG: phage protein NinX family protein [Shewanella sp.]
MKDYSKMSDFEICGYVSMYEHGFSWIEFDDEMSSHVKCGNEGSPGFAIVEVKDYCNNPSDAWTIIIENSITFNYDTAQVHVGSYFSDTAKVSENRNKALRAAMIVYLMMNDE